MTREELARRFREDSAWVSGKRIKIDFGDHGLIILDGNDCAVAEEDGPSDSVVSLSWADFEKIRAGELDPMSAYVGGRLRIAGDMAAAMQLASVLSKARN